MSRAAQFTSPFAFALTSQTSSEKKMAYKDFDGTTKETVAKKLKWLPLLFVIDKRSQVRSKILAAAEQNICECILVSRI